MSIDNIEDTQTSENGTGEETQNDGTPAGQEDEVAKLKAELEKERSMRQGLVSKLKRISDDKPEKSEAKPEAQDDNRLDRLELLQIDNNLTDDQIKDALTIKKAKGYSSARDAYNDPMFSSFLSSQRTAKDTQDKIDKATPAPDKKGGSAPQKPTINSPHNWAGTTPKSADLHEVASVLEDRFLKN